MKIGIFNIKNGKLLKSFEGFWEAAAWVSKKHKAGDKDYDEVQYAVIA